MKQLDIEFPKIPQWQLVLNMLKAGSVTTARFCSTMGLASEYRRCVSDLRRKGYQIDATRLREGCWEYELKGEPK